MIYLFFDTETTGLPKDYKAPSSDLENWSCRLVQLSWLMEDENMQILSQGDFIIKPDGFEIPKESSDVHGITTEFALERGVDLKKAVYYFLGACRMADIIVGHNVSYDMHVVGAELIRTWGKDYIENLPTADTMLSSIELLKIPGKYGYKYPKLMELYKHLFDCEFDDAHNSFADITATAKCFWELKSRGLIKESTMKK